MCLLTNETPISPGLTDRNFFPQDGKHLLTKGVAVFTIYSEVRRKVNMPRLSKFALLFGSCHHLVSYSLFALKLRVLPDLIFFESSRFSMSSSLATLHSNSSPSKLLKVFPAREKARSGLGARVDTMMVRQFLVLRG